MRVPFAPLLGLPAGLFDDLMSYAADQASLLRDLYKLLGVDQPPLRVPPACQGFHTADLAGVQLYHRLVVGLELLAFYGSA